MKPPKKEGSSYLIRLGWLGKQGRLSSHVSHPLRRRRSTKRSEASQMLPLRYFPLFKAGIAEVAVRPNCRPEIDAGNLGYLPPVPEASCRTRVRGG